MNRQLISALSLSGLLLACAHGRSNENVNARASVEARHERAAAHAEQKRENAETRAENAADRADNRAEERADNRADRRAQADGQADGVDIPKRRQRGEMASAGDALPSDAKQPDNTGVNERDRGGLGLTAADQGNSEADVEMTQRIRRAVMDTDLSFAAKNVKIITRDGQVVLRGPVNSAAEKDTIFKLATSNAGAGHVTNQLEVKSD